MKLALVEEMKGLVLVGSKQVLEVEESKLVVGVSELEVAGRKLVVAVVVESELVGVVSRRVVKGLKLV